MRTITITRQANLLKILQLEAQNSKAELEKNLAMTQVAYLRSQINPHFLFNTLNYIYNAVDEVSPKASEGILLLADIMRYSLSDTSEDGKVSLLDEIEHIVRFIALTQRRFSNELFLSFHNDIPEDKYQCKIPPLILLTFVENVLKHGNLTHSRVPGEIIVSYEGGSLLLKTRNLKRKNPILNGKRIGIENARTRLSLYYTVDQFSLVINDTATHFIVDLRIKTGI